jgi:uncharacterized SAM-binding protein YcdF (DUF218 family)
VTAAIFLIPLAAVVLVYGWHRMQRSNREKAALLTQLAGQYEVTLHVGGYGRVVPHTGMVVRVEHGLVVVRERYDFQRNPAIGVAERSFPLAAVREIQQGDSRWGPW